MMQLFQRKECLCLLALWPAYALGFCANQTLNTKPYPYACQAFILCLFSKAYLQTCQDGQFFDIQTNNCQPLAKAQCSNITLPIIIVLPIFEKSTIPESMVQILLSTCSTLKRLKQTNSALDSQPTSTSSSNLHRSNQSEFKTVVLPTIMTAASDTSQDKLSVVNSSISTGETLETKTTMSESSTHYTSISDLKSSQPMLDFTTRIENESGINGVTSTNTDTIVINRQSVTNKTETNTASENKEELSTSESHLSTQLLISSTPCSTTASSLVPKFTENANNITGNPVITEIYTTDQPKYTTSKLFTPDRTFTTRSPFTYITSTLSYTTMSNVETSSGSLISTEMQKPSSNSERNPEQENHSMPKLRTLMTIPQTTKLFTILPKYTKSVTPYSTSTSDHMETMAPHTLPPLPSTYHPCILLSSSKKSINNNEIISTTPSSITSNDYSSHPFLSNPATICKLKDIFLFPDPKNCRFYISCFFGKINRIKCEPGYEFNPYLLECVPELKGNCYKKKSLQDHLEFLYYFIKFHKLYSSELKK